MSREKYFEIQKKVRKFSHNIQWMRDSPFTKKFFFWIFQHFNTISFWWIQYLWVVSLLRYNFALCKQFFLNFFYKKFPNVLLFGRFFSPPLYFQNSSYSYWRIRIRMTIWRLVIRKSSQRACIFQRSRLEIFVFLKKFYF